MVLDVEFKSYSIQHDAHLITLSTQVKKNDKAGDGLGRTCAVCTASMLTFGTYAVQTLHFQVKLL